MQQSSSSLNQKLVRVYLEGDYADIDFSVENSREALGLAFFLLESFNDSHKNFQIVIWTQGAEALTIQKYVGLGVSIQYYFEKERPFYKSIGRAFVAFGTDDTESIHDPYTEWEQVYRYNYLPLEKAKEVIKDFYMNGLDAMANYTWDGSMPKQPGPG